MSIIDNLPDNKLTKRQVNNLRSIWMRKAHQLGDRIIASVLGEDVEQPCECGKTISFPGTGEALSTAQIGAAKIIFSKVFPDIAPEDFNSVTEEPKTKEQVNESIAVMLKDKSLIKGVADTHYDTIVELRDYLVDLTKNVKELKTG